MIGEARLGLPVTDFRIFRVTQTKYLGALWKTNRKCFLEDWY